MSTPPKVPPSQAPAWCIECDPDDLEEGLFGQVVLWTFELLPEVARRSVRPDWAIRSRLYGSPPGYLVLPGVFELAYTPTPAATGVTRRTRLLAMRVRALSVLGGDWGALHQLWQAHFRVPARILRQADAVALPPGTLGLHYRGTDKNQTPLDTNPVSVDDFFTLARAFLAEHPQLRTVFLATDDPAAIRGAEQSLAGWRVINLGPVSFHKSPQHEPSRADRALLDCVLLSRCDAVLKCSSALSGFAKVLNPALACYRVSASKMFGDVPYFPDAHVPRLQLQDASARAILARQFEGDWLDDPRVPARFRPTFTSLSRHTPIQVLVNWLKYRTSVLLGRPRKA